MEGTAKSEAGMYVVLECYFYSKSIFKPPSVSFLLEATPLGALEM